LPTVHDAITLNDLVAKNQDEKLAVIEDLALVLGNQLSHPDLRLQNTQPFAAIIEFISTIDQYLQLNPDDVSKTELQRLTQNLRTLTEAESAPAETDNLEKHILGLLPYTLNRLKTSLTAEPFEITAIPHYLSSHWVSADGFYKILIQPEFDLNNAENLKQFVLAVQSVDAAATGLPVADIASGLAVVKAFIQAFSGALLAIFVLLLLILKSLKNTLLIIGPLLLAGLLTGATNVLLNNPFNFANIIALPLLLGMGVDSGIHILHRLQLDKMNSHNILRSSSARGVFFSSLTTLFSFSSLAFTSHRGTASMGLLLAIGISFTLLCTLIVLPAFYGKKS